MRPRFGWILVLVALLPAVAPAWAASGALRRYVAEEDASFAFKTRHAGRLGSTDYEELILTSQTWRGVTWKHQLFLLRPSTATADARHALFVIGGGDWKEALESDPRDRPMPKAAAVIAHAAEMMGAPVAILLQVPAQPIMEGRREDALIAHTFDRYLDTGDERWPLLLPMVKSAVRGMDAVQEVARQRWGLSIDSFTVTGASKRGWTTWLTGAVDGRATAIAPMVIDMLNIGEHLRHQIEVWGAASEKISDYTEKNLHRRLETGAGRRLQAIIDPYHYRASLRQPKLIICGTNDRYWPLDALNLYWHDLVGPKWVLYVPNNRHGLKDLGRVFGALHALHRHAAGDEPLPALTWSFQFHDDATALHVRATPAPRRAVAWVARSATRDFREAQWEAVPMEEADDGFHFRAVHAPEMHLAFFGEGVFDRKPTPLFLSTSIRVVAPPGNRESATPPAPGLP